MRKKLVLLCCCAALVGFVGSQAFGATLDLRITDGLNDAEQHLADGVMDIDSTDLEFPYEDNGNPSATDPQLNIFRFNLALPKGTVVSNAYLELEQDETKGNDKPVNVIIEGQLTPDAPAVKNVAQNLSSREPWTVAKVKWTVPMGGKNNDKFQSPDLSAILTELLAQDGWASGNAILLAIRDDAENPSTGLRCVEAVEGEAAAAPLLHVEAFVGQATNPDPADGAPAVNLPLLTWTAGETAVAHNVYFGTSPELTAADLVGPGQPVAMYYHVLGFEPGVTYYWRVDEVDAAGTVYTGAVWKFTAEPVTAWGANPADGAVDVFPVPTLSWTAGKGAVGHQVFLGTNRFDVILGAAAADKGKMAETTLATDLLALGTTYYWRVDEIQPDGTVILGPVWSFTTAEALEIRVASGPDDAEEHLNAGMDITSTDLEIVHEDAGTPATDEQLIGLRWTVPLAKDTAIANAYVEFELKEIKTTTNDAPVNVIIEGQLDPNPAAFTTTAKDITDRVRTKAQVAWTIPAGLAVGTKFQTPDISAILTELTSQDGWAGGNAVVIILRDDKGNASTGLRCVTAYNGGAAAAPLLHIEVAGQAAEPAEPPKATILWISEACDDTKDGVRDDDPWIGFLTAQGYEVDYRMGPALGTGFWRTLDQAKLNALNAADLVIVSRNMNSGEYNNGSERDQWNGVKTPLLLMSPHVCRSSHWKWYNSTSIPNVVPLMKPEDVTSPAFTGVTLNADGNVEALIAGKTTSFLGVTSVGNGTVLARSADGANVWIAWWAAGTEFYAGAGQSAGGTRVFFAGGTQETSPTLGRGEFNLTDSGQAVFLNVLDMMLQ